MGPTLSEVRAVVLIELEGGLEDNLLMDFEALEESIEDVAGKMEETEDRKGGSRFEIPPKFVQK